MKIAAGAVAAWLLTGAAAVAQTSFSPAITALAQAWKACAFDAGKRYANSAEPAEGAARVALLSCRADLKKLGVQMNAENLSGPLQLGFVETFQKSILEDLAVQIMEQRIRK